MSDHEQSAGLTSKEAWWAGARAALKLPGDTPRKDVAERMRAPDHTGGELIERIMLLVEDERMDGEAECEHRNACREEIRALLGALATAGNAAPQDGEAGK